MPLDDDARFRALAARDARFDGVFFVGVTTTGVYCRPICPARTPGRSRCRFFRLGAQAEQAGFRACFRCRPELAPGSSSAAASVDAISTLCGAAVRQIERGALNHGGSVPALAGKLGVSARHLRRAMKRELGVTPVQLAQSRRLALAKQLLADSKLGLARVAFASGFSSVRRFNASFAERFGRAPSEVRRGRAATHEGDGVVPLTLGFSEPYAYEELLRFLSARLSPGVAEVEGGRYRQTLRIGEHVGWLEVRRGGPSQSTARTLRVDVSTSLTAVLPAVAASVRGLFDLDARPVAIAAALGADDTLARAVAAHPGLRVPGTLDPFELVLRTILGQQISVKAATTLATRFAATFGQQIRTPWQSLNRLAPTPASLARRRPATLQKLGVTGARAATILAAAQEMSRGALSLEPGQDLEASRAALLAIRGIGPWTVEYLAMRALRDPDAFPSRDLGLMRALGLSGPELERRAEAWRPFRAYAAMALWRME